MHQNCTISRGQVQSPSGPCALPELATLALSTVFVKSKIPPLGPTHTQRTAIWPPGEMAFALLSTHRETLPLQQHLRQDVSRAPAAQAWTATLDSGDNDSRLWSPEPEPGVQHQVRPCFAGAFAHQATIQLHGLPLASGGFGGLCRASLGGRLAAPFAMIGDPGAVQAHKPAKEGCLERGRATCFATCVACFCPCAGLSLEAAALDIRVALPTP